MIRRRATTTLVALVGLSVVTACGGGGGTTDEVTVILTPEGQAGREVMLDSGCASCHGQNGEGGVGPTWIGVAGSMRTLEDGTEVLADRDYLVRSIVEPQADKLDGYTIAMPVASLTDAQVESIVDYLEELS